MKQESKYHTNEKVQYREEAILKPGKKLFGKSLPKDKQYWTLCGGHTHKGKLSSDSELPHMVTKKFISFNQFIGIDKDAKIIKSNLKVAPDVDWRHGDILGVMKKEKDFNPGIIHLDTTSELKLGNALLGRVLRLVAERGISKCMIVYNVIVKNPQRESREIYSKGDVLRKNKDILENLQENSEFLKAISTGEWLLPTEAYSYPGVNSKNDPNPRTIMSTFIFKKL